MKKKKIRECWYVKNAPNPLDERGNNPVMGDIPTD